MTTLEQQYWIRFGQFRCGNKKCGYTEYLSEFTNWTSIKIWVRNMGMFYICPDCKNGTLVFERREKPLDAVPSTE